jgi:hypothetical protein
VNSNPFIGTEDREDRKLNDDDKRNFVDNDWKLLASFQAQKIIILDK